MKKMINLGIFLILLLALFSTFTNVAANNSDNNPPEIPSIPLGPTYGEIGERYMFCSNTTDPDGDMIRYGWDFNNNGSVDMWSSFFPSGGKNCRFWYFWKAGNHNISVKAEDEHGAQSDFSEVLTIYINTPPDRPYEPNGQCTANLFINYSINTNSKDADGDLIFFMVDWGDQISKWIGPYKSDEVFSMNHSFQVVGIYKIRVRCKDIYGSESDWSKSRTVTVTCLLNISLPIINFGSIKVNIFNNGWFDLKNVSWNITIQKLGILRNIDIYSNGTIKNLDYNKKNVVILDKKIFLRLGFVKIEIKISIDELVVAPYRKTFVTYGFILGRIIFVSPYYYSY